MADVNFSQLTAVSAIDAGDQILIRRNNALSGSAGFARIQALSAFSNNFNSIDTGVRALTSLWDSTYSTVYANSAAWASDSTTDVGVRALTATWQSTYTSFNAQSASNESVYTTVNASSGSWGGGGSLPAGGTTNQVLVKNSNTNSDASWKNKRITVTLTSLTATDTIASNALSADQFVVAVSGVSTLSATIGAPSNPYDAQIIMWNIRYTTNIARVLLDSSFRLPLTTLNWTISANRMDIMAAKYNALDSKWDVISFAPGYII